MYRAKKHLLKVKEASKSLLALRKSTSTSFFLHNIHDELVRFHIHGFVQVLHHMYNLYIYVYINICIWHYIYIYTYAYIIIFSSSSARKQTPSNNISNCPSNRTQRVFFLLGRSFRWSFGTVGIGIAAQRIPDMLHILLIYLHSVGRWV